MPQQIYYRFWCSSCNDFTLQGQGVNDGCRVCGTVTTEYNISEVPEEKLIAQRQRYLNQKKDGLLNSFSYFQNPIKDIFSPVESIGYKVIETDAGQKDIDDKRLKELDEIRAKRKELKEEYELFYRHTGRNEPCPCGKVDNNGKPLKYKKCCINKFNNI